MRRTVAVGWLLAGCGATVPVETHRQTVADQRTKYEQRLFEAERARLRCVTDGEQAATVAETTQTSLQRRIDRLERAAARDRTRRAPRTPRSAVESAETLRRALDGADVAATSRGELLWQVPVARWFDDGSYRLRATAGRELDRLAEYLAEHPGATVAIRVPYPQPLALDANDAWRSASERGVVVVTALQRKGIAPVRLTLRIGGGAPDGRILFEIRMGPRRRPGTGSLDSRGAGRHSRR